MSDDVENQLREIKTKIGLAVNRKARAEAAAESAQASLEQARTQLRTQFGVETPEDGRRVLSELEAELATALSETQQALERTMA